ncbi:hypothetical protein [Antrihabitans sp. YC2-6]|uniref:hypothetical protein n=1 Tax=Antrihabitans sp. YC2-6 TaxID=2799498 RepID=UPI0018F454BA|nr:hypothetical protein [Antrihabitans sp. YC2-6]MBJ8346633.1 hypothetical protein [Antrihabitans sp. YC2-6]
MSDQLLDAALTIVGSDGLSTLSLTSVEQQTGIDATEMYPSRAELLAALLAREHERGLAELLATVSTVLLAAGPNTDFIGAGKSFVALVAANPARWRLILDSGTDAPDDLREQIVGARSRLLEQTTSMVALGLMLKGTQSDLDPGTVASFLLGTAEFGCRLVAAVSTQFDPKPLTQLITTFAEQFAN